MNLFYQENSSDDSCLGREVIRNTTNHAVHLLTAFSCIFFSTSTLEKEMLLNVSLFKIFYQLHVAWAETELSKRGKSEVSYSSLLIGRGRFNDGIRLICSSSLFYVTGTSRFVASALSRGSGRLVSRSAIFRGRFSSLALLGFALRRGA